MKKHSYRFLFLIPLFLASSCNLDNFDFNKLSDDVSLSPELVMPMAKADITVWDIIESVNDENDTLLKTGDKDIIKIVYTEENIYEYEVRKLVNLPDHKDLPVEEKAIGNIKLSTIAKQRGITIKQLQDNLSGAIDNITDGVQQLPLLEYDPIDIEYVVSGIDQFERVKFAKGELSVTLKNNFQFHYITVEASLIDKLTGNPIKNLVFNNIMPNNSSAAQKVTLDNLTFSNSLSFRLTKFIVHQNNSPEIININSDIFSFDMSFNKLEITSGRVKVESQQIENFAGSFNFDFDDDVKVFAAELKGGSLEINSVNTSPLSGTLYITFPEIKKLGSPIQVNIPFNGQSGKQNLSNALINMASDVNFPYNKVPYTYTIALNASSGYIDFDANDYVRLNASLDMLDFKNVQGDFGKKQVKIDDGNFNMDMEFLDKITGDFRLANPKLQLILTNGIGVPAKVEADFVAQDKNGKSVSLNPTPFMVTPPASLSSPVVKQTVTFDKTNSNIVEFVALPPSGNISYTGDIFFNPTDIVSPANPNFFDLDSKLQIDLGVDLPFELQVNNLTFEDTAKIDSGDLDKIKTAELIVNAINEIPLDIDVQLFFVDTISGQQFSSSAKNKLLSAAQISDTGVITATNSSHSITLNETELSGLKKANGIIFKGTISSPSNGTKSAVIYSKSKLNMSVSIKAKLDL